MGVLSLGLEDPLEKEMATHSSIFAWRIPWTEEPGGLQSMRSQRVRRDLVTQFIQLLSRVRLFATPWTVTCQAPLSMDFSRQKYWNGLPCPPPGNLSDPGIKPASLTSPALAGMLNL